MAVASWQAFAERHQVCSSDLVNANFVLMTAADKTGSRPLVQNGEAVTINDMPVEILRQIFENRNVIDNDETTFTSLVNLHTWQGCRAVFGLDIGWCVEHASIMQASRVCRRWRQIVLDMVFRETTSPGWSNDGWQTRGIIESMRCRKDLP